MDKTLILEELCPLAEQGNHYICITRPRRFGKTIMANMISTFFAKGIDSSPLFEKRKISNTEMIRHRNQYNAIHIDFSKYGDECDSYKSYTANLKELLKEDLSKAYLDCGFRENGTVSEDLMRIHLQTGERFIFVLDEWDAVFHMPFIIEKDKNSYLLFLKNLLKDQPYVSQAYMTGILPIAEHRSDVSHSSGSELNMFFEFSMAGQ